MHIETTKIQGVYIITPQVHRDERGFFMESFRDDAFKDAGITDEFIQDNHSRSTTKNVIRGLHFQYEPPMSKVMRVTKGSAFLVAVDIRKGSKTLGAWLGIEATEENMKQLYAPAGFARGFQTLTDICEVQYKCSALYNPDTQGVIAWDDPDIAIDWPIKEYPLVSGKNSHSSSLRDWLARPESDIFMF
jgi:dTDP-4-dehydrorhamnose 3,5-epimerase